MIDRKLGRGLDYLISDGRDTSEEEVRQVETEAIRPNPYQPRREFDLKALRELEASVKQHGILQPILLRQVDGRFEIIAGERRWRAARAVGLEAIPAIVKSISDDRMLELALVENLQREDLNAIERARAYRSYTDSFGLTQEEAAARLGMDRSTLANTMRLLDLPDEVRELVSRGTISMGHARALLSLDGAEARQAMALRIVEEGLSVRALEQAVRCKAPAKRRRRGPVERPAYLDDLESRLRDRLGTRVRIEEREGRGKITIEFYSREDFDRVLDVIEQ